jgi:hypothetical protein
LFQSPTTIIVIMILKFHHVVYEVLSSLIPCPTSCCQRSKVVSTSTRFTPIVAIGSAPITVVWFAPSHHVFGITFAHVDLVSFTLGIVFVKSIVMMDLMFWIMVDSRTFSTCMIIFGSFGLVVQIRVKTTKYDPCHNCMQFPNN